MRFTSFPQHEHTMRQRLICYMLVLIAVVLTAMLTGLSLIGRYNNDKTKFEDTLELQLDFWEKTILSESDSLAAMGIDLAQAVSAQVETQLRGENLDFDALQQNDAAQLSLQNVLLPLLRDYQFRADASGVYVLLDTTINPEASTRFALYLQRQTLAPSDSSLLLYRGRSGVGKQYGIMPHRKWRLEMESDLFSNQDQQISYENLSDEWSYRYSPIFTLPGTSEQAILLQVPVQGQNGEFWGICGFEISQTYFKQYVQPAIYPHLSFMLTSQESADTLSSEKLVAGTTSNYFLNPSGSLSLSDEGSYLQKFSAPNHTFIGLRRTVFLYPGSEPYTIAAMLPEEDYDHMVLESFTQSLLLFIVMLIFAVVCCVFFSKTYLLPIIRGLEKLKTHQPLKESGVQEINDLFSFLVSQNQAHENALRALEDERNTAENRAALIQQEYDEINRDYHASQTEHLNIGNLQSVSPNSAEYEAFQIGLTELTKTERKIVQYYFEGKTVKDIQALMDIKESTLRYHNRNIYGKLGVHSMKQLLQFAVYTNNQRTTQS